MSDPAKTVIILEDDPDISDLLAQLVSSYGARTVICETEAAALEAARDPSVALALLDIMLPGTDGREIASRLREMNVGFPVFFMTGIHTNSIGEEYCAMADGILQKPFSVQALRALLDKHLPSRAPDGASTDAPRRKLLELMATVATDREELRRQQARLLGLIHSLDASESQPLAEQFKEFGMGMEATLQRVASRLEEIRNLTDPDPE